MKKTLIILTALILTFALSSCASVKEIPEDKTPSQILQMGTSAAANGSYKSAELCFKHVIENYSDDVHIWISAMYELGHNYSKQKKYEEAEQCFTIVLNKYDELAYKVPLDPSYKKLCEIGLDRINEKKTFKGKKEAKVEKEE